MNAVYSPAESLPVRVPKEQKPTRFDSSRRLGIPVLVALLAFAGVFGGAAYGRTLTAPAPAAATSVPAAPAATVNHDAKINAGATPAAGWLARNPELPAADAATVHNVTLDIVETSVAVAPGVTQHMWTFNGSVPGPILRGKVGDTFNITINNKGGIPHSLDFHASMVSPSVAMKAIPVNGSTTYSFVAHHSGIYMYHCGVSPTLLHIGEGMYGAVVVDPPNLASVDHEYFFVQSELYLGPNGGLADYSKMLKDDFDAVVFNGYYNQYAYSPIKVGVNQRIRAWVMDDGPSESSSWHLVGTIFDTVYKEGAYTLRPDASEGGSQALDLMPAQGGFVEFTLPAAGNYTFVTHKFSNVVKGAAGVFQAQ